MPDYREITGPDGQVLDEFYSSGTDSTDRSVEHGVQVIFTDPAATDFEEVQVGLLKWRVYADGTRATTHQGMPAWWVPSAEVAALVVKDEHGKWQPR